VDGRLWLVGDGGEKSRAALDGIGTSQLLLPPDEVTPSAVWVGRCGQDRLADEGPDDVSTFEPLYVKEVHATPSPSPFA
jgi:tRNA threonylcarbamoyladenosine biosynthesis protein TsaB